MSNKANITKLGASEPYVPLSTAAQHFAVSERTLRRFIASRDIPAKRLGRSIRLQIGAVENAMTSLGKKS